MRPCGIKKLKDVINPKLLTFLADSIINAYEQFNYQAFVDDVSNSMQNKSFFERIIYCAKKLHCFLPEDFEKACIILLNAAPPPVLIEGYGTDNFQVLIICRYISIYGLDYPDLSLKVLAHLTQSYTAEFDVRPFIEYHPVKTFSFLEKLTQEKSFHMRRLASEACRPRLPMAKHLVELKKDPLPCLRVLNLLRNDKVKYVQRSVANNLADIIKDNPSIVYELLSHWARENNTNTNWIITRALRRPMQRKEGLALELLSKLQ